MLIYLVQLNDIIPAFNIFRYITVRSAIAILLALTVTIILSSAVKRRAHSANASDERSGGFALWSFLIASIFASDISSPFCLMVLFATIAAGVIGWASQKYEGLRFARVGTFLLVTLCALSAAVFITVDEAYRLSLEHNAHSLSGWLTAGSILLDAALIIASTYCLKLAGDVDDNVINTSVIVAAPYTLAAYFGGNAVFAGYLQIDFVPGVGEFTVLVAAMIGSGFGILWFTSALPRFEIGVGTRFAFGMFIGIGAVGAHSRVLHALAIVILAIEPLSIYLRYTKSSGLRRRVFAQAPFIRKRQAS